MIGEMAEKKTKAELIHPFTLIDTVWRAYSKRVPFFTKLVLAPILFYLLLDTLSYLAEHGIPGQPLVILAQTIEHTVLLSIPLYTLAVIIQTFSTAAVLTVLTDPKITDVGTAYSKGAKKIVSLWWVSILSFLITSGGFLLFVIPGVMFSVWFVFSQYVLFNEGKRGVTALLQSREYVRGYFWQVTLRILFIALIAAALSSISGYVSMIFNNGLLAHMAQSVVSLITLPLVMI